jgi:hypothetical protein
VCVCVSVNSSVTNVVRQRLDKHVTAVMKTRNNRKFVGRVVFYAVQVLSKEIIISYLNFLLPLKDISKYECQNSWPNAISGFITPNFGIVAILLFPLEFSQRVRASNATKMLPTYPALDCCTYTLIKLRTRWRHLSSYTGILKRRTYLIYLYPLRRV